MNKAIAVMLAASALGMGLGGCAVSEDFDLPMGSEAYRMIPAEPPIGVGALEQSEYRIYPYDELTIIVYREPDLSVEEAPVEAGGGLILPLIGRVEAAGRTTLELSGIIEQRLRAEDLLDPRVAVIVAQSQSQTVTVDGAVLQAGVYGLTGRTTLLQSIALAQGATRTAALDKVAIFRTIEGQRYGALFDVLAIREGRVPDPRIESGDYVLVASSARRSLYFDVLSILPAAGVFVQLAQ